MDIITDSLRSRRLKPYGTHYCLISGERYSPLKSRVPFGPIRHEKLYQSTCVIPMIIETPKAYLDDNVGTQSVGLPPLALFLGTWKTLNNACGSSGGPAGSVRLLLTICSFNCLQVSRLNGSRDTVSTWCVLLACAM